MKEFLKRLPYTVGGVMLAFAALGNLLGQYHMYAKYFCGMIATIILIGLIAKIKLYPSSVGEAFKLPPVASVMVTIPMGIILLASYLSEVLPLIARLLGVVGALLYLVIMIQFTRKHVLPFKLEKVLPSYFVAYIGIVVISVTAKGFGYPVVGQIVFYFGLLAYVILLPIVSFKWIRFPKRAEPIQPLVIIFAAPANLLLVGYLKSMSKPSVIAVAVLLALGIGFTLFAWFQLPKLLKLPFYPSYAAFAFPLVIAALASRGAYAFLTKQGINLWALDGFANLQMIVSIALLIYVTVRFVRGK